MLLRLKREITDRGPDACLPVNLTDEWLQYLTASADSMLQGRSSQDAPQNALCVAVVVCLLQARADGTRSALEVSYEQLHSYFEMYRVELALEQIHRKTNVKYNAATLDTILTRRPLDAHRDS